MLGMAHKGLKLRGNRFLVALCALVLNTLGFAQSTDTAKVNHESGVISANYWTLGIEHSSGMFVSGQSRVKGLIQVATAISIALVFRWV